MSFHVSIHPTYINLFIFVPPLYILSFHHSFTPDKILLQFWLAIFVNYWEPISDCLTSDSDCLTSDSDCKLCRKSKPNTKENVCCTHTLNKFPFGQCQTIPSSWPSGACCSQSVRAARSGTGGQATPTEPWLTNTCMGCCLVPISTTQQRTFIEYLSCLNTDQHMHGLLLSANIYNTATHLYWISTTQQHTFTEYLSYLNTDQHWPTHAWAAA